MAAGTTAVRQADMPDDRLRPRRSPGVGCDGVVAKANGEDPPRSVVILASEALDREGKVHAPAMGGKVQDGPYVTAVDPL
jgi:hypothetical protein